MLHKKDKQKRVLKLFRSYIFVWEENVIKRYNDGGIYVNNASSKVIFRQIINFREPKRILKNSKETKIIRLPRSKKKAF